MVHQEVDLEDLVVVLNLTMVVVHLQLVVIMVRHLVVLEGVEVDSEAEPPLLVDHMEHREEAILLVTEVEEDVNQEEERQHLLTGNLSEISPDGLHLLIEFEPLRIENSRNILSFEMCSVMLQLLVKTVLV